MYRIALKQRLNPSVYKMVIEEPAIASKALPGQFVVLRIDDTGERIPLTVFDTDKSRGTVAVIFQQAGKTTLKLSLAKEGDSIKDFIGPLGIPTHIQKFGKVLCVAGGVGSAEVYPCARALSAAGNEVVTVIGARTKELIILEEELAQASDKLHITTDDGSYIRKGFVTDVLGGLFGETGGNFDRVFAIGPAGMMKAVCQLTKRYNIKTIVSLNSIMVDATGMCGACRVSVGGKTKFVCVDGPEFDGHLVDFEGLIARNSRFLEQEKESQELFKHKCFLEKP